ncbi:hypothetical protein Tco_0850103, partial [Tanacetum coccineum]
MSRWMRCGIREFPFTYLGLPIEENMRRIGAWNTVIEKFKKRLSEWKAKSMSFGGRLTLVKSVLALKGRIPVREELDKIGIDLDTLLCPCNLAMSVWEKIFKWWKVGNVNAFSIGDLFNSNGNVDIPNHSYRVWQAVIWTCAYYIWKERNSRVFKGKVASTNKFVQDIQL